MVDRDAHPRPPRGHDCGSVRARAVVGYDDLTGEVGLPGDAPKRQLERLGPVVCRDNKAGIHELEIQFGVRNLVEACRVATEGGSLAPGASGDSG